MKIIQDPNDEQHIEIYAREKTIAIQDMAGMFGWRSRTTESAMNARFYVTSNEAHQLLRILWERHFGIGNAVKREILFKELRELLGKLFGQKYSDSQLRGFKQELVNANHPIGSTQTHGYWYCANNSEVLISNQDKLKKIAELSHQVSTMTNSGMVLYGPQIPLL